MGLIKKLLNKFNGLHYSQDYLCLSQEQFENPLHVYLANNRMIKKDVTQVHLFVGYHPLLLAFASSLTAVDPNTENIEIIFSHKCLQENEILDKKDAIARLSLKKINQLKIKDDIILFYEGADGHHHFVSAFHQLILQWSNQLYNKKPGNVFLEKNLYKQVQIAYCVPRKISLITVGENNLYNHFPTDLHGRIAGSYVISLRHSGNACKQVESAKKIVLSDMDASTYKKVYALGKNHTQPLKDSSAFDFDLTYSRFFHLPLPKDLLSYKELELKDSFIHDIHKLLLFNIVYEEKVKMEMTTLAHIHNVYASWRYKRGISSNLLLR